MVGEKDSETPVAYAEGLAQLIPGAALKVLPDIGHLSNIEAPEAVNQALHQHLKGAAA
jgi:pimeloyl-ACP methyl ester carboxylesterase